jgi:hypothetical protein
MWGKARGALCLTGKKSILLEGTQAMPARPSDKDRMGVKTLGWWVEKLETETAEKLKLV